MNNQQLSLAEQDHLRLAHSYIRQQIEGAGGAIPFDRFMELALYTPGLGYYAAGTRKFGQGGDFITAPELSPLFGQCVANQCAQVLLELGGGSMLEFGAGSGVLAVSVLKRLQMLGNLPDRYCILELSAELRTRQQALISEQLPHLFHLCCWLDELPQDFVGVVLANEVLDAMPVHRFRVQEGQIQECFVHLSGQGFQTDWHTTNNQHLLLALADLQSRVGKLADGYESEINLRLMPWLNALAAAFQQGLVLLVDYGYSGAEYYHPERSMGTLIAHFRHQAHADVLALTGLQDITANVDFSLTARAGLRAGFSLAGFTTQAHFLLGCGLDALLADTSPDAWMDVVQQAKQLILPAHMGERFKVLGLGKGLEEMSLIGFSQRNQMDRL